MLDRNLGSGRVVDALTAAIAAGGTAYHLDRLIDLVGALVPHDVITVTRYATDARPVFLSHRRFSDAMVARYLEVYYAYDPFYAFWRREQRPGIVPLRSLADDEVKRGRYIGEFLRQSVICDEVGVLVGEGAGCCLGIFLDRADRPFGPGEIEALETGFPAVAALHARHGTESSTVRTEDRPLPPPASLSVGAATLPPGLWPALTVRERELATLILAGHPTLTIARRLGIAVGTVKNHRHRIYAKLDITSEREMFLQYFDARPPA